MLGVSENWTGGVVVVEIGQSYGVVWFSIGFHRTRSSFFGEEASERCINRTKDVVRQH